MSAQAYRKACTDTPTYCQSHTFLFVWFFGVFFFAIIRSGFLRRSGRSRCQNSWVFYNFSFLRQSLVYLNSRTHVICTVPGCMNVTTVYDWHLWNFKTAVVGFMRVPFSTTSSSCRSQNRCLWFKFLPQIFFTLSLFCRFFGIVSSAPSIIPITSCSIVVFCSFFFNIVVETLGTISKNLGKRLEELEEESSPSDHSTAKISKDI